MDLNALPFDADAMLAGLRTWVACESPTFDAGCGQSDDGYRFA